MFYKKGPNDLMPIITPAFPSMNTTHNVSNSTKRAIMTEFEKGVKIVDFLIENRGKTALTWKRLFKKFNFFKAYSHFIQI